jgi:hypothetical protein
MTSDFGMAPLEFVRAPSARSDANPSCSVHLQNGSTAGRIDVANPVDGAEQNQEEHGDRHEAGLGLDADAERDHEQRRQSDLRNATESP